MKSSATRPADLSMMPIIHDAFRRDLRRLGRLVDAPGDGPQGPDRTAARALWSFLLDQLEHHHTSEDERLWPLVRGKDLDATQLAVLDEMEKEHAALEQAIEELTQALRSSSTPSAALSDAVRRLEGLLEDHLDHEEREAVPLVETVLSQADLSAFERHQKKRMGLRGAAMFFPWLLDGLDDARRAVVLQQLPKPLRYLAQNSWQRRYQTESRLWRGAS